MLNAMNGGSGYGSWGRVIPGDVVYKDINGDGRVDNYDRAAVGNPRIPELQFGLPLGFQYKNLDFSMLFQGSALSSVQLTYGAVWDFPLFDQNRVGKVKKMHLQRWTPETAATAKYPALHYGVNENNKNANSSLFLYNAAYMRLKNVEIGYSLPKKWAFESQHPERAFLRTGSQPAHDRRHGRRGLRPRSQGRRRLVVPHPAGLQFRRQRNLLTPHDKKHRS